ERAAERDAVEAADQRVAVIDFEAVAMPALVELAVESANARVDPGARTAGAGLGAARGHGVEGAGDGGGETAPTPRAGGARRARIVRRSGGMMPRISGSSQ